MRVYKKLFNKIVDIENLFLAWEEFKIGKTKKPNVLEFEKDLEQNIFQLRRDLVSKKYEHGDYADFYICDPKKRHVYKATVRDRVVHHAIFKILNPIFEPTFIANSFSCRIGKGNHKGVDVAGNMMSKVSRNYTGNCYILKCDVRKFFDTIDHSILLDILSRKIRDQETMGLIKEVVFSYKKEASFRRERERE